jgi:hypothetical protein
MKQIFEVATAMLASLGGGTAILFGLSSWLGKVWANRILEKEKAEHNKEIEHYKSELNRELTRIGKIQDKELYISKAQYDNEYKIYQEIWGKMHECIVFSKKLYPTFENMPIEEKEKEEYQMSKHSKYVQTYNDFSMTIDKYAPFYREDFYKGFLDIRNKCSTLGRIFYREEWEVKYSATYAMVRNEHMSPEESKEVYITIPKELDEMQSNMQKEIREYLLGLQLKD